MSRVPYIPKFCRTRGCTMAFGHDGSHNVPVGVHIPVERRRVPKGRHIAGTYKRVSA